MIIAGPRSVYDASATYEVQGAAPGSTFAWGGAGVVFSPGNARSAHAAFAALGRYTINCVVTEPGGDGVIGTGDDVVSVPSLNVEVFPVAKTIRARQDVIEIDRGKSAHFPTDATDQFGGPYPHNVGQETYGPLRLASNRISVHSSAPLGDHRLILGVGGAKRTITVRVKR